MMSAPSSASRTAWLRPWPRAAPVIKATLPSSLPATLSPPAVDLWGAADRPLGRRSAGRALEVRVDRVVVRIACLDDAVRASPDCARTLLGVSQDPEPPAGQSGEQDVRDLIRLHHLVKEWVVARRQDRRRPEPRGPVPDRVENVGVDSGRAQHGDADGRAGLLQ